MISSLIALLIKVAIVLVVVVVIKSLKSSSSDNSLNKNTSTISDRVKSYAQENQEYYESLINNNSFNFNDRFNIGPDKADLGDYGEFLTFKEIVRWSSCHSYNYKILRNLNIGTHCEIDLVWIHETGIYVFESKNISGQIYGDENSNQWCKILNNRTKNNSTIQSFKTTVTLTLLNAY